MPEFDLFSMRESYRGQQILLCFNGPISRSLIEEIGQALRGYLASQETTSPSAAHDIFGAYIEMTQNIRQYVRQQGWPEQEAEATVLVARAAGGHHVVMAGNLIASADGPALLARIAALADLDKPALKILYKKQLRKPRTSEAAGAGLGLIDIARKASAPLQASVRELGDGHAFFCLHALI